MLGKDTCFIDTEKVTGSVETLLSIDNCLSNKNLQDSFFDMEDLLNKLTFEHGNFSTNYKDTLEQIEEEISVIKKEIYELGYGVEKTKEVLNGVEEKTAKDVQELSSYYGYPLLRDTPSNTPLKVFNMPKSAASSIAEVITSGVEEQQGSQQINTVPIGVGIGVAGVVGAVGAVALDSIRYKEKDTLESYQPPIENKQEDLPPAKSYSNEFELEEYEDLSPYSAIHNRESMNKFYNENQNNNSDKENY